MAISQTDFRFRDDDGSETGATWKEDTNVDADIEPDENFRYRLGFLNTVNGATVEPRFQYNLNGGGWNDITDASSVVRYSLSSNFAHEDDTTQQITSGDFFHGAMYEEDETINETYFSGESFESEACLQIIGSDVSGGDTIQLRASDGVLGAYDTYAEIGTATVPGGVAVTPAPAAAIAGKAEPQVFPLVITPAPASAVAAKVDPNIIAPLSGEITFVGAGSANTENDNSGTSSTVNFPTHLAGDLLIAIINASNSATNPAATHTVPEGWTELFDLSTNTGTANGLFVAYKFAESDDEVSSVDFTASESTGYVSIGLVYRGVDSSDPIDDSASGSAQGNASSNATPAVSTTVENALVLRIISKDDNVGTPATPSPGGYTLRSELSAAGPGNGTETFIYEMIEPSTGDTGAETISWTGDSEQSISASFALTPLVETGIRLGFNPSSVVAGTVNPTVVESGGGATVNPAAAFAVAAKVDANIELGDLSIAPAQASSVANKAEPSVQTPIIIAPAQAAAVSQKLDPAVGLGSLSLTPSQSSAVAGKQEPQVNLGPLAVTPSPASAISEKAEPSTILGSTTPTPAVASTVSSTENPTVLAGGNVIVTPAAAAAVSSKNEPAAVLGSITLTPSASGAAGKQEPDVALGAVSVTPNPSGAAAEIQTPGVILGPIVLTPAQLAATAANVDPAVDLGDLLLTPPAAATVSSRVDPALVFGDIAISGFIADAIAATAAPAIFIQGDPSALRTLLLEREDRVLVIEREDRTLALLREDRTLSVEREIRTLLIEQENRTLESS